MSFPNQRIGNINSLTSYQTENHQNEAETNLVQKPSFWQQKLPKTLLESVSLFLTPVDLGRSIRVCELWKSIIDKNTQIWNWQAQRLNLNLRPDFHSVLNNGEVYSNVLDLMVEYADVKIPNAKNLFANPKPAIAFGRQEYIDYGLGDPGEVPPLPANIHEILQSPCEFWPGKRVEETHALVLIVPGSVNSLDQQVKNAGNGIGIDYFWNAAQQEHGDKKVEKPYWALMTKDVIPGSRNKSYAVQKAMVEAKGYEVPSIYEATTVIETEYLCSGKRLFSDNPSTYTRCKEKAQGYPLVVGGFAPSGLRVSDSSYGSGVLVGVAALRKVNAKR